MKTNPIFHRIIRGRKPNYLLVAIIIIVIGCLMMATSIIKQPYDSLWIAPWIAPLKLTQPQTYALSLLLMGMVISLSMTTAAIFHGQILPQNDSLLRTTLITDRQIMYGSFLGVLHRGAYWLSAIVGAMIFTTILSTINDIFIHRPGYFPPSRILGDFFTLSGGITDIFILVMLPTSGFLMGMFAALRFRQTGLAVIISGVAALMLMVSAEIAILSVFVIVHYIVLMPSWKLYSITHPQAEFISLKSLILLLRVAFATSLTVSNIALLSAVKKQLRRLFPTTTAA